MGATVAEVGVGVIGTGVCTCVVLVDAKPNPVLGLLCCCCCCCCCMLPNVGDVVPNGEPSIPSC